MAKHSKAVISNRKKEVFLEVLKCTGNVSGAALAAGYASSSFLVRVRKTDAEFAEKWDDALEASYDLLEAEALRRAVDGVMEPEYYQGTIVGYKVKYSDGLLTTLLKANRPDKFRDNMKISGEMTAKFGIAIMPAVTTDQKSWLEAAQSVTESQKQLVKDQGDIIDVDPKDITELKRS